MRTSKTLTALTLASLLAGCAALEEDKINYKSSTKAPTLEVPPDLTQLSRESRYNLQNTSATASGFAAASQRVANAGTASNSLGDVRMERTGSQRWLVVNRPAEQVWDTLKEFWISNGFVLSTDAPELGILETDWAENRAKLPQDFIRQALGKVLDSLYSTGERDKYRTRVERNANGGVDIYITHRGMIEDYADAQKQRTIWRPRAADPELEIEFLRRLMVKLGGSKEQATTATTTVTGTVQAALEVSTIDGQPTLELTEDLDRAWRRTGVALDRTGFTVEDRDRTKGIYFVRYVPAGAAEEPGFFARMLSSKKELAQRPALTRYQVQLQARSQGGSLVQVRNASGQTEGSENAVRILKLIASELR